MKRTMRLGGLALLLAASGCDEDCEEMEGGGLLVHNETSDAIEVFVDTVVPLAVLPAGANQEVDLPRDAVVVARDMSGGEKVQEVDVYCCEGDCGELVFWEYSSGLWAERVDPECPEYGPCDTPPSTGGGSGGEGGGSCPYVFVQDGNGFVLTGETLVGALNRGAERTDVFSLPRLKERDGLYEIRLAAVLRETDFIDRVALRLVDHPAGTELVVDGAGNMLVIDGEVGPTKATDAAGRDVLGAVASDEGRSWSGRNTSSTLRGTHRDWLEIELPRPADPSTATLLVRGRSTQLIQDSYHRYMAQFGGGAHTALRLLSHVPGYGLAIDELMQQGAFGVDVELEARSGWREQGTLRAIGPAGMRTVALPLREADVRDAEGPAHIRLRLSVLPGGWEIDSARLANVVPVTPDAKTVPPHRAVMGRRGGPTDAVDLETLTHGDGVRQAIEHAHQLTVDFDAPSRASGFERTAVLEVTGYYEEHPPSLLERLWIRPFAVVESFVVPEHFTDFVIEELREAGGD